MFTSLVVALDLEANGDRALPVVRALARLADVAVELVTVSSPRVAEDIDSFELSRRATASGWPAHAYTVLHGDDVAQALVDHVRGRHGSLLVMATSAKRPLVGRLGGSVSTRVLALTDRPVLLVGPMVSPRLRIARPTLVVGVGPMEHAGVAVSTIASWTQTFPGDDPWVVEVVPTAAGPIDPADAGAAAHLRPYVELLAGAGVRASSRVLQGGEPGFSLEDFAEHIADPVLVATSARWTDGQRHWHSETRELVRHSTHPVLVVPAAGGAPPPDSPAPRPPRPATSRWRPTIRLPSRSFPWRRAGSSCAPVASVGWPSTWTIGHASSRSTSWSTARRSSSAPHPARSCRPPGGADVEFEVDHYDASTGRAWSVIVAGRATEVTRADEWEQVHDLLLFPWHLAPKPFFVRIVPEAVTGRRFRAVYAGADEDETGPVAAAGEDPARILTGPACTVASSGGGQPNGEHVNAWVRDCCSSPFRSDLVLVHAVRRLGASARTHASNAGSACPAHPTEGRGRPLSVRRCTFPATDR